MEFIKRFFKCLWQKKIMMIVIVISAMALGLLISHQFYNPSHEYYKVSFKTENEFNDNITKDDVKNIKNILMNERNSSGYYILNNYKYDISWYDNTKEIIYDEDKETIKIYSKDEDKYITTYGRYNGEVYHDNETNSDYILLNDYWLYVKKDTLIKIDSNTYIYNDGLDIVECKCDLNYKYSFSSFEYVDSKNVAATSYFKEEDGHYSLYMQRRYFNSWQQARRFIVNMINNKCENVTYLLKDGSDLLKSDNITPATYKTAIKNEVINEIGGTNIYFWMMIGGLSGLGIILLLTLLFVLIKKEEAIDHLEYDNKKIFKTPFHKKYILSQFGILKNVRNIAVLAMLFAMMQAVRAIPLPSGFGNLGISISMFFFAIIAMIFGPIPGFFIGVLSDIFGFFVFPNGYPFHIGYTIQAALTGFTYGIMFYKTKISFSKCFFARLIVNLFLNAIFGSILWGDVASLNHDATMTYFYTVSLPKNIVYLLPQSALLYLVFKAVVPILKTLGYVDERISDDLSHPFRISNEEIKNIIDDDLKEAEI